MKLGIIVAGVLVIAVAVGLIIPLGTKTNGKQAERVDSMQPEIGLPASSPVGGSPHSAHAPMPTSSDATPATQFPTTSGTTSSQRVGNPAAGSTAPNRGAAAPTSLPLSSGFESGGATIPQPTGIFAGGTLVNQQSASGGTPSAEESETTAPNPAASASPGGANASQGETVEIVQEVPRGASVPALFYDEQPRTPQQSAALDRIARDFNEAVSNPPPDVSETENWEAARRIADERYLNLFGYKAFNQHHLMAAKEAAKERKAANASVQSPSSP